MRDTVILDNGDLFLVRAVEQVEELGPPSFWKRWKGSDSEEIVEMIMPRHLIFRYITYRVLDNGTFEVVSEQINYPQDWNI